MADKPISIEELMALVKGGAEIRTEQRPTFIATIDPSVEQFDALLKKLDEVVKIGQQRIDADLSRHQDMVELMAALQRQIKAGAEAKSPNANVDLTPLTAALNKTQSPTARPNYEFNFERSRQGFVEKILVSAVQPSKFKH